MSAEELAGVEALLRRAEDEGSLVVSIQAVRRVIGSREQVANAVATRRMLKRLAVKS